MELPNPHLKTRAPLALLDDGFAGPAAVAVGCRHRAFGGGDIGDWLRIAQNFGNHLHGVTFWMVPSSKFQPYLASSSNTGTEVWFRILKLLLISALLGKKTSVGFLPTKSLLLPLRP
jgi:hypothetical protein